MDFSVKHIHTGETTSTTASPLPPVLLHKEEEYEYYKADIMKNVLLIVNHTFWILWILCTDPCYRSWTFHTNVACTNRRKSFKVNLYSISFSILYIGIITICVKEKNWFSWFDHSYTMNFISWRWKKISLILNSLWQDWLESHACSNC